MLISLSRLPVSRNWYCYVKVSKPLVDEQILFKTLEVKMVWIPRSVALVALFGALSEAVETSNKLRGIVLEPIETTLVTTPITIQGPFVVVPPDGPTVSNTGCGVFINANPRVIRSGSDCGGVMQSSCNIRRGAEKVGAAKKNTDCPFGSFKDIGAGGCYACPSGTDRTGNHVDGSEACLKWIYSKSSLVTKMSCNNWSGSFFDPIDGGTCWTCPDGFSRTWDAVTASTACASGGWFGAKAHATKKGENVWICPSGSFYDPLNACYSCPSGYERTTSHVEGDSACRKSEYSKAKRVLDLQCERGSFFDLIEGGTCWKCPVGFQRTWDSVTSSTACINTVMNWITAREDIGFFNMPQTEQIIWSLAEDLSIFKGILDGTEAAISALKIEGKVDAKDLIRDMEKDPANSSLLKNAVLFKLFNYLNDGAKTKEGPEYCLSSWMATFTRSTRIWMASEAEKMMVEFKNANRAKKGLADIFGSGVPAPPFTAMAEASLSRSAGLALSAVGVAAVGIPTTLSTGSVFTAIQPFAVRAFNAVTQLGIKVVTAAASASSSSFVGVLSAAAGPAAIILSGVLIGAERLTTIVTNEEAFQTVNDAVVSSKRPSTLETLVEEVRDDPMEFATMFHRAASGNSIIKAQRTKDSVAQILKDLNAAYP